MFVLSYPHTYTHSYTHTLTHTPHSHIHSHTHTYTKYLFEIKFNSIGDLNSQSSVYLKLYCCYFFHFIHSAIGPTYLLSTFWHFYRSIQHEITLMLLFWLDGTVCFIFSFPSILWQFYRSTQTNFDENGNSFRDLDKFQK